CGGWGWVRAGARVGSRGQDEANRVSSPGSRHSRTRAVASLGPLGGIPGGQFPARSGRPACRARQERAVGAGGVTAAFTTTRVPFLQAFERAPNLACPPCKPEIEEPRIPDAPEPEPHQTGRSRRQSPAVCPSGGSFGFRGIEFHFQKALDVSGLMHV